MCGGGGWVGLCGWAWWMGMAADEVGGGGDRGGGWRWGCECGCGGRVAVVGVRVQIWWRVAVVATVAIVVGVLVVWRRRRRRRSGGGGGGGGGGGSGCVAPSPAIGGSAGHAGVLWLPVSISLVLMVRPKTRCGGLMRAHAGSWRHGGAYRTLTTSQELGSAWVKRKVAVEQLWATLGQTLSSP
ncbi:hypothetical protein K439DRAFT_1617340 [Ramaria rubella]|nr:hypothetical protein K439DRAFT_1617340 [Ramaria rubella]